MPSFKKSLIVDQFQGNCLKPDLAPYGVYTTLYSLNVTILEQNRTNLAELLKKNKNKNKTKQNKTAEHQLWREYTGDKTLICSDYG